MVQKKVAVIGGGLGGLSAAARLAVMGFEVDLFEKNETIGGKANQIDRDGFRFDTGPSLITMPFVIQDLFKFTGERIENYLSLKKLDVLCKYLYPDSIVINAYSDTKKFAQEISENSTDDETKVEKYLNYCKRIYDLSAELFLFNSFTDPKTFLKWKALKTLFNLKGLDTGRTMHEANSSFFDDPRIIQLFDRYATYNGSNPFEAPATLNIIQHVEYNLGGYIAEDGIFAIPKAIEKLAVQKGVKIHTDSKVKRILKEDNSVKAIDVDGKILNYNFVIANSDVQNTYNYLLNDNKTKSAKKYNKLEKSSSAIVFYWGVIGLHEQLEIHNILFSKDYKKEFDQLFEEKIVPDDPTIYIYISSKYKKSDAPDGCENWFVMINAPYSNREIDVKVLEGLRDRIINKIDKVLQIKLRNKIISESLLTPAMIEKQTSSLGGSIYGISSNNKMAAFLRQQNKSKEYEGLYFCGGSAHPGGGIPLVLLSGKLAAEKVAEDFG